MEPKTPQTSTVREPKRIAGMINRSRSIVNMAGLQRGLGFSDYSIAHTGEKSSTNVHTDTRTNP